MNHRRKALLTKKNYRFNNTLQIKSMGDLEKTKQLLLSLLNNFLFNN